MALQQKGVAPAAVFAEANVPLPNSADPMQRILPRDAGRLFDSAIRATGDPYIGIHVGLLTLPSSLHALGFGLLSSRTLDDFCQRINSYWRIVSQNASFKYITLDRESVLLATDIIEDVCYATQDVWVVYMVKLMRQLYQRELNPLRIDLMRPVPDAGKQPYLDFFKCPVRFGRREIRICIDNAVMYEHLPGASRELARYNDDIVSNYLVMLDKQDLINRVRNQIISQLATGTVGINTIAEDLHMSPRSLQQKLAALNNSFQGVLDGVRRSMALGYIEQSHLTITEISYLLGFAEASNFTRAFKRWTSKSPSEYRKQLSI